MAVLRDAMLVMQKNSVMSCCAMLRWWYDAMSCGGSGVMELKCGGLVLLRGMVDVLV